MPFYFFVWTPEIVEHLAEHGVTQDEFEDIVSMPEGETASRPTGNHLAFGTTRSVRVLCCVFRRLDDMVIEPITVFEIEE